MPRFRKTSRLTKKGGSDSGLHLLADLANRPKTPENKPITTKGSMSPNNPSSSTVNDVIQLANTGMVGHSPVQTNLNRKFNLPPNDDTARNHGGGYKKSRKNSRIKSKRKKGGKSAKKRRRRTRGKKR